MTALARCFARGGILSVALLSLALAAGCASDEGPRSGGARSRRNRPFPTLTGQEVFFDGHIVAELKVGAMTGFTRGPEGQGESGRDGPGGRRHGGGGFSMNGMGMGGGRREGGGPGGEGPGAGNDDPERVRMQATRRADAMAAPPVMIHLRFTNHGPAHVDLVVADFLSPLGNFVVTPEKLSLDPGQSIEVEPMTSRLAGEITGGEVALALRQGTRTETKTVTLKAEPTPEPPAPPPAH